MARDKVVEIKCDRCKRVAYVSEGNINENKLEILLTSSKEQELLVQFEDLCDPCLSTVRNHIDQISKEFKGKSPNRTGAEKKGGADAPQSSTPESEESVADFQILEES